MSEIKMIIGLVVSSVIALLSPIRDVMLAMLVLFVANFLLGLLADIVNGPGWSGKKALGFGMQCAVYFGTIASLFAIGHLIHQLDEAMTCIKVISIITTWVFAVNIFRNGREIMPMDSSMYRVFDILHYIASVQAVEKLPWVKAYIEARRSERNETAERKLKRN